MVKIITALENEHINNKLKKIKDVKIITKDIQYKEGILEILEFVTDIDYILLNNNLEGEISINELVEKIKEINEKIKIILIINKKEEKNKYIDNKKYYKVFYENEIKENIFNNNFYLIKSIEKNSKKINIPVEKTERNVEIEEYKNNKKYKNNEIKKEIKELKKIIRRNKLKNNKLKKEKIKEKIYKIKITIKLIIKNIILKIKKTIKNNFNNKKLKFKINNKNNEKNNHKKINYNENIIQQNNLKKCYVIYTIGTNGIGKSSIIINLAQTLSNLNKKTLIIDFDFINKSIHTILGVKDIQKENYINKINKNIDLISPENINMQENKMLEIINKINILIIKLRKNYDYIFIDTNSNENFSKEKIKNYFELINNSDLVLFVSGCNLLEINKSAKLLENYLYLIKTKNIKINILFNKYNNYSIEPNLLKNIFYEFNTLGFINDNEKYNLLINTNIRNFNMYKKIKSNYLEIINSIEKNRRRENYGN